MPNTVYHTIKSQQDVDVFDEVSNGLHDGYLTRVLYDNSGIVHTDECLFLDYTKRSLLLQILVTSLREHPTFELRFSGIVEFQIRDRQFNDMIGFSVLFLKNGSILWANDVCSDISELKHGTYVIAESMEYRKI